MSLILLVDVSGSVDQEEYKLQKDGIVAALMDPSVHRSIYNQRGICIMYMEFSDTSNVVVPWQIVETPDDAINFAAIVAAAGRSGSGSTNVYGGIVGAMANFANSPCAGERVIDVSGDGSQNVGGDVPNTDVPGLRINGLPITKDEPNLAQWYLENVVRDGFVLPVSRFEEFPHAIRQKLAREIAERIVENGRLGP